MASKTTYLMLSGLLAALISLISLKYFSAPYFWAAMAWTGFLLHVMRTSPKTWQKATLVNIGAVFIILGLFELYLWANQLDLKHVKTIASPKVTIPHDALGYVARGGSQQSVKAYYRDQLLYDVQYTFNEHGWRRGPDLSRDNGNHRCILFFGGSYLFGLGLNDEETVPFLVESKLRKKNHIQTYNFTLSGYGPHQTLSLLEHELEKQILKGCQPIMAIFLSIHDHVNRVLGRTDWDHHGPRYIVDTYKQLQRVGNFDDEQHIDACEKENYWKNKFISQIEKSLIYQALSRRYSTLNECELELYFSIVNRAKEIFEERYVGSVFYTFFWDNRSPDAQTILAYLKMKNFQVQLMSSVLPAFHTDGGKYRIHPVYETHPSPLTAQLFAKYVVEKMVKQDHTPQAFRLE